jgi:hypothetical protein
MDAGFVPHPFFISPSGFETTSIASKHTMSRRGRHPFSMQA